MRWSALAASWASRSHLRSRRPGSARRSRMPATDRVQADAEGASRVEQVGPVRAAPLALGGEDDEAMGPGAHDAGEPPRRRRARRRQPAVLPSRPPRRPPPAPAGCSRNRAIHSWQSGSLPFITSAAITAALTSMCNGLVIADVIPDAIAIGRNAPFSAVRLGSPKLTFEAPQGGSPRAPRSGDARSGTPAVRRCRSRRSASRGDRRRRLPSGCRDRRPGARSSRRPRTARSDLRRSWSRRS